MKDLCAELWNFLGNVMLRKILGTFAFGKNFLRGPWNGRGPKFWNTPPQPETGWHGPGAISPWWVGVGQGQGETNAFRGDVHTHIATQYVILTFSF